VLEENEHLRGFDDIHKYVFQQVYKMKPISRITLDQDATFIPTETEGALINYKKFSSFEVLNIFCPKYDMMIAIRCRDGNMTSNSWHYNEHKDLQAHKIRVPKIYRIL
jgi:hypothetical protein